MVIRLFVAAVLELDVLFVNSDREIVIVVCIRKLVYCVERNEILPPLVTYIPTSLLVEEYRDYYRDILDYNLDINREKTLD